MSISARRPEGHHSSSQLRAGKSVSVCIATFNGVRHLREQFSSIVSQLDTTDEIIVVDDGSVDSTLDFLRAFGDSRIKVYSNGRNRGHVFSFARAISLAGNDVIFMADQDDIWLNGRVARMKEALRLSSCLLLSSNSEFIDANGQPAHYDCEGVRAANSSRFLSNIVSIFTGSRRYYGCAMAFKKELCSLVLPVPNFVESHDLWIALAANVARSNLHLDENTLKRRLHGGNASVLSRSLAARLWSRLVFLASLCVIISRLVRASSQAH